jgi:macrodomain Ter protein organizer (MatP/YcbG family)
MFKFYTSVKIVKLSEKMKRSQANTIEILVDEAAKKEKIKIS